MSDRSRYVLCEGEADEAFIRKLAKAREIRGLRVEASVRRGEGPKRQGGLGGFPSYLAVIREGVARQTVKASAVLIVRDCDDGPEKAFREACGHLRDAGFPVPKLPQVLIDKGGVTSGVVLLPDKQRKGNLETLVLESLKQVYGKESECVDRFFDCVRTHLNHGKLDKGRMTCLKAAIALSGKPDLGLLPFIQSRRCPIDFSHVAFDELAFALREFAGFA